jgi:hypothetical protein
MRVRDPRAGSLRGLAWRGAGDAARGVGPARLQPAGRGGPGGEAPKCARS